MKGHLELRTYPRQKDGQTKQFVLAHNESIIDVAWFDNFVSVTIFVRA